MKTSNWNFFPSRLGVAMLALALGAGAAWAQKPDWAGQGNGNGNGKGKEKAERSVKSERTVSGKQQLSGQATLQSGGLQVSVYFGDSHRQVLRDYYGPRFRSGNCPPGLAKKNNGCMPPGQAKNWRRGQVLPRDVMYYPLPHEVAIRLGTPPEGHKFVRIAADILLIAVGTGMVVDAIEDLSNL